MGLKYIPTPVGSSIPSTPSSTSDDISSNNTTTTSMVCWFLQLSPELLQTITEYLTTKDIISLSQSCLPLYILINDDNFWIHRIRCQFHPAITHLYTYDLFQQPQYAETNDEPRPSGFAHKSDESDIDQLGINAATHYNDEAIAKRHAKMYVSKEDFAQKVRYFQYSNDRDSSWNIPFMKLVYFYLIDRKRTAAVDIGITHRNDHYLVEEKDDDSLKGRIIHLRAVCWLAMSGKFEHEIMPGKYQVIWRMKTDEDYIEMCGETEFIVVPSHGKLLDRKLSEDDFETYALEHNGQWFLANLGEINVYEPSKVLMAIRNWNDLNWKSGISWDCVELKLVP